MSPKPEPLAASEAVARHLAETGEAGIARMQAAIDRAREMLARGEVVDPSEAHEPTSHAYPWEHTERSLDGPKRVWLASVEDYATGEGLTLFFAAGLARGEDEFRRRIALELGRGRAHRAAIGQGLKGEVPFIDSFVSARLRAMLERFDQGEDPPATMSFFARYAENRS